MHTERSRVRSPFQPLLAMFPNLRPGEGLALFWSSLYFFLILTAYYILRPIRDNIGAIGGVKNLSWLFSGSLVGMLLLHPVFAWLVTRVPRQRFIAWTYRFFMLCLVVFYLLFRSDGHTVSELAGGIFFVWVSVFNLFVVSVFWSHMTDLYRPLQSRRLFGIIAVGGTFGAIFGAGITSLLSGTFSAAQLLLVSAAMLEIAIHVSGFLERQRGALHAAAFAVGDVASPGADEEKVGGDFWDGVTAVMRSPYLLNITTIMLLFTLSTTFIYFQQAEITKAVFGADAVGRTKYFANVDLIMNVLTAIIQLTATGRLLRLFGVGWSLTLVPLISIAGFVALGVWPTLTVLAVFSILRRAGNYGLTQPARQVLYTVLSRSDKYKAKNFNDTFVYRAGDQFGAWSYSLLGGLGFSTSALAFLMVPVSALHAGVSVWIGRRYRAQEDAMASASSSSSHTPPGP